MEVSSTSAWVVATDLARQQLAAVPGEGQSEAAPQRAELHKAVQDFEAFFVGYVMQMAYRAIPKSDFLGGQSQQEMFQTMFVQEASKSISQGNRGFGLGKMIETQLARQYGMADEPVAGDVPAVPAELPDGTVALRLPVAPVTSEFGPRADPFNGRHTHHRGIDLAMPMRTPLYAAADGEVEYSGWKAGYGKTITLRHGDGLKTTYAHNDEHTVRVGDSVRSGELIGYSGSTGRSTGPHLHFEVAKDGKQVNPARYAYIDQKI